MGPPDRDFGAAWHPRPLARFADLSASAAELLRSPPALLGLSDDEAKAVVAAMTLFDIPKGATLLHEHDRSTTGHMLLILDGEVSVEVDHAGPAPVAISVLGAGSLIGEMSLLDGQPRSTHCSALSAVQAAGLSRQGLDRLIERQPRVAARLLAEMGSIIATRLRALSDQLRIYARLAESQQREIARLKGGGSALGR
jgi:CRP/FNR family transcriptional regulator, cyclic AMP receptor protein